MARLRTVAGDVSAAALAFLIAIAALGCADPDGSAAPVDLPPYVGLAEEQQVDPADFLGAEACAECHDEEYERWASSTHGRAGGRAEAGGVLAPFDGAAIVFADAVVTPTVLPDGAYAFVVAWDGAPTDTFTVDGVVGGGHMRGGGTQGFFSASADGTLRFLPFDWSHTAETWFCNARLPVPGRWRRVTGEMRLAECADWPPRRALGHVGQASCDTCHGSQIRTEFDTARSRFRTEMTDLRINCESCHGPGREHVALVTAGRMLAEPDLGLASLATSSEDESLETCFRCHATRVVLHDEDLPGERLTANVSLLLPQLTDRTHFPDGRIRTFGYQLNHRASACYLDGAMTCTSCHEPHAQTYQDEYKRTLDGPLDDGQCLGCHASKAAEPERHTFHAEGSDGGSCVGCHMPYLPQPILGDEVPYARSDHVIPIPRPGFDEQFGVTSACAGCHAQVPLEELAEQVADRYGEIKPWRSLVEGLARAPAVDDPADAAELLLRPGGDFAMAQASGISQYLVRFVRPDMDPMPAPALERLQALARAPDLDVAALAAASLHLGQGRDTAVRAFLARLVDERGPDGSRLRDRWAEALRYVGDVYRLRRAYDPAARAYERALEARPGYPPALEGLGAALLEGGDPSAAEETLRRAIGADGIRPGPYVLLARAIGEQERPEEELALLEDAVSRFPLHPLVHFELGNALLRRRDAFGATLAFERTLELDVSLASPRLGLAQILAAQGRMDLAQEQVELALAFEPENPQAQQLMTMLRRP